MAIFGDIFIKTQPVFSSALFCQPNRNDKPQLPTPTISLVQSGSDDFAIQATSSIVAGVQYRLLVNGAVVMTSLSNVMIYEFDSNGTYQVSVKIFQSGYKQSKSSNVVEWVVASRGNYLISIGKNLLANLKRIILNLE